MYIFAAGAGSHNGVEHEDHVEFNPTIVVDEHKEGNHGNQIFYIV